MEYSDWLASFDRWVDARHRAEEAAEAEAAAAAVPEAAEPEAIALPLPGGHVWRLRAALPPAAAAAHADRLRTAGATFATWHALLAAADLGWTLPYPSPADMPGPDGWAPVPLDVAQVIGDWLVTQIVPVLSDAAAGEGEAAA